MIASFGIIVINYCFSRLSVIQSIITVGDLYIYNNLNYF